jgi:hypothetical protein
MKMITNGTRRCSTSQALMEGSSDAMDRTLPKINRVMTNLGTRVTPCNPLQDLPIRQPTRADSDPSHYSHIQPNPPRKKRSRNTHQERENEKRRRFPISVCDSRFPSVGAELAKEVREDLSIVASRF